MRRGRKLVTVRDFLRLGQKRKNMLHTSKAYRGPTERRPACGPRRPGRVRSGRSRRTGRRNGAGENRLLHRVTPVRTQCDFSAASSHDVQKKNRRAESLAVPRKKRDGVGYNVILVRLRFAHRTKML